jgi:hypothetical protein
MKCPEFFERQCINWPLEYGIILWDRGRDVTTV